MDQDILSDFLNGSPLDSILNIPFMQPDCVDSLQNVGIHTILQLIGIVFTLYQPDMSRFDHTLTFHAYLEEHGINDPRITRAVLEKANQILPGIYDEICTQDLE